VDENVKGSILKRVEKEGFALKLGLRPVSLGEGRAVVEMIPQDQDTNIFGMIHGGAIFSLMDEAFQLSCNSHGTVAVALSVSVVFHNQPELGKRLRAESIEVHRSRKTATYEIKVTDDHESLIASCKALAYRKGVLLPFLEKNGVEPGSK
jgi:acyl-CoA thioesterase